MAALLDVGVVLVGAGGVVGVGGACGGASAAKGEAGLNGLDEGRDVCLAGAGAAGAVIALRHVDGALGRAIVGAGGDGRGRARDAVLVDVDGSAARLRDVGDVVRAGLVDRGDGAAARLGDVRIVVLCERGSEIGRAHV